MPVCLDNNFLTEWSFTQIDGMLVHIDIIKVKFKGQGQPSNYNVTGRKQQLSNCRDN